VKIGRSSASGSISRASSSADLFQAVAAGDTGLAGTPLYVDPRRTEDLTYVDPNDDLYALGIVLYEMWSVFSTQMDRCKSLEALRANCTLPEDFSSVHPLAAQIIPSLVGEPARRPSAGELIEMLPTPEQQEQESHLQALMPTAFYTRALSRVC